MKIVSLDASTKSTGYAVFEDLEMKDYGLLKCSDENIYDRIAKMYKMVEDLIIKNSPDYVAIENVPLASSVNKHVAEWLLVLQGTIFSITVKQQCGFITLQPSNWRKMAGIVAEGRKREQQKMAAISLAKSEYGVPGEWIDKKTDEKTGVSDYCEAILIGKATLKYLGVFN